MERSKGGVGFGQFDGAQKTGRSSGAVGRLRDAEIQALAHLSKCGADGGFLGVGWRQLSTSGLPLSIFLMRGTPYFWTSGRNLMHFRTPRTS